MSSGRPRDFREMMEMRRALTAMGAMNRGMARVFRQMSCGAKTRRGQPCMRTDLFPNGRCRFHGGASTGPKTEEGRQRALANLALGRVKGIRRKRLIDGEEV